MIHEKIVPSTDIRPAEDLKEEEQPNYIQYSLTGIEPDFLSYEGGSVNRYDATSSLNHGSISGYDYPEKVVASLENGIDAVALSSGMTSISLMMELFAPGAHLIADADLYGESIHLFDHVSKKNGIQFSAIDCCREDVENYIREDTKAIFQNSLDDVIYPGLPEHPGHDIMKRQARGSDAQIYRVLAVWRY